MCAVLSMKFSLASGTILIKLIISRRNTWSYLGLNNRRLFSFLIGVALCREFSWRAEGNSTGSYLRKGSPPAPSPSSCSILTPSEGPFREEGAEPVRWEGRRMSGICMKAPCCSRLPDSRHLQCSCGARGPRPRSGPARPGRRVPASRPPWPCRHRRHRFSITLSVPHFL